MSTKPDIVGVVRQHRWMSADKQAEQLRPLCREVVSLGGGHKMLQRTRVTLEMWATDGRAFMFVHAFLLAEPTRSRVRGGLKADFRAALARIEKKGGVVIDATGAVSSKDNRKALLALVDSDIARSNRGKNSGANAVGNRGRPRYEPTEAELKAAKAIWRNVIDYPEWADADKALRGEVSPKFTAYRAYALWKGRQ